MAQAFSRASGLSARFARLPIEHVRAYDQEVDRMFEWMDRRQGGEPDLPRSGPYTPA